MRSINTLVAQSHPIIMDAYVKSLKTYEADYSNSNFLITSAKTCDEVLWFLSQKQNCHNGTLFFLDLEIQKSISDSIKDCEDLCLEIRQNYEKSKIIISTNFKNAYRISSVIKSIDPDALLVSEDITHEVLNDVIDAVLQNLPYYSKTIIKIIRKQIATDVVVDKIDRKILYELSNGTKMKELPDVINLSLAALERRKRMLKELFNVKGDRQLINEARDKGFV